MNRWLPLRLKRSLGLKPVDGRLCLQGILDVLHQDTWQLLSHGSWSRYRISEDRRTTSRTHPRTCTCITNAAIALHRAVAPGSFPCFDDAGTRSAPWPSGKAGERWVNRQLCSAGRSAKPGGR